RAIAQPNRSTRYNGDARTRGTTHGSQARLQSGVVAIRQGGHGEARFSSGYGWRAGDRAIDDRTRWKSAYHRKSAATAEPFATGADYQRSAENEHGDAHGPYRPTISEVGAAGSGFDAQIRETRGAGIERGG